MWSSICQSLNGVGPTLQLSKPFTAPRSSHYHGKPVERDHVRRRHCCEGAADERVIADLEDGRLLWVQPWDAQYAGAPCR